MNRAHDHFIFLHIADYAYDFFPPSDPDVRPSVHVCEVEHISFHFGLYDMQMPGRLKMHGCMWYESWLTGIYVLLFVNY